MLQIKFFEKRLREGGEQGWTPLRSESGWEEAPPPPLEYSEQVREHSSVERCGPHVAICPAM